MQVAKAIIDPTPEWFLDTIRVVAIPRLRREIRGLRSFSRYRRHQGAHRIDSAPGENLVAEHE